MSSLVSALKANHKAEGAIGFETDAAARIVIPPEEAAVTSTVRLASVGSYFRRAGSRSWTPDVEVGTDGRVADDRWLLVVAPERLVVWLPLASGLFGGMKQMPGKATGGVLPLEAIDRIERWGPLGLIFYVNQGDILTEAMSLGLEFPDARTAAWFGQTLAARLPTRWAEAAESARDMLKLGLYEPDSPTPLFRFVGDSLRREAAVDPGRISAEVAPLRDLNWNDPAAPLAISLARAGAPV